MKHGGVINIFNEKPLEISSLWALHYVVYQKINPPSLVVTSFGNVLVKLRERTPLPHVSSGPVNRDLCLQHVLAHGVSYSNSFF